jgi:hypothetical protein
MIDQPAKSCLLLDQVSQTTVVRESAEDAMISQGLTNAEANSGKAKPHIDLKQVTAASALAACNEKASIVYSWVGWKKPIMPAPMRARPKQGASQKTWYCAVQPYSKYPVGKMMPVGKRKMLR